MYVIFGQFFNYIISKEVKIFYYLTQGHTFLFFFLLSLKKGE